MAHVLVAATDPAVVGVVGVVVGLLIGSAITNAVWVFTRKR